MGLCREKDVYHLGPHTHLPSFKQREGRRLENWAVPHSQSWCLSLAPVTSLGFNQRKEKRLENWRVSYFELMFTALKAFSRRVQNVAIHAISPTWYLKSISAYDPAARMVTDVCAAGTVTHIQLPNQLPFHLPNAGPKLFPRHSSTLLTSLWF